MMDKFHSLRDKYQTFTYDSFSYVIQENNLLISFHFIQSDDIVFNPELIIPFDENIDPKDLEVIIFNIGMIELISYYKACCSPKIIIKAGYITEEQMVAINEWIESIGGDCLQNFKKYIGVDDLDKILAKDYKKAITALKNTEKKKKGAK